MKQREIRAGLLGATGAVGQRYINMLSSHPFIKLEVLMGGESAGKRYGDAVRWLFPEPIADGFAEKTVRKAKPESAKGCDVVFSALPSEVAKEIEPGFAEAGFPVVSEASAHRMDADVPLMIPEINSDHLSLLETQQRVRGWKGSIVTTPNCTVTGLAIVLKPLVDEFSADKAIVTTMQALSGAGFPGVASLLIMENVLPYIKNEEEKVAKEARKILGTVRKDGGAMVIEPHDIPMGVDCNRVAVIDGHTESLYCEFPRSVEPEAAVRAFERFKGSPQKLKLPTAPSQPIIVRRENDRPQPRLDRMSGSVPGMSVVVGRVRNGIDDRSLMLTLLSHNTIRGAAGNAILTAELMQTEGYIG
jgi:aspartate-semialdehyde dehydrogenase